jgi:hypothetical protein
LGPVMSWLATALAVAAVLQFLLKFWLMDDRARRLRSSRDLQEWLHSPRHGGENRSRETSTFSPQM